MLSHLHGSLPQWSKELEEFVEVGSVEGIKNGSVIKFEEGEIIIIKIVEEYGSIPAIRTKETRQK